MKSSETGGPRTKNSCQRRPALPGEGCCSLPSSHCSGVGDQLIERFSPSLVEAHFLMSFALVFASMHDESAIFCPASLRLERDDRGEGQIVGSLARRPIARSQRNR